MERTEKQIEFENAFMKIVLMAVRRREYTPEHPLTFFFRIFGLIRKDFNRMDRDAYHEIRNHFARIYVNSLRSLHAEIKEESDFIQQHSVKESLVTEEMRAGARKHEALHRHRGGYD